MRLLSADISSLPGYFIKISQKERVLYVILYDIFINETRETPVVMSSYNHTTSRVESGLPFSYILTGEIGYH